MTDTARLTAAPADRRIGLIDALRGVALVAMAIYHFCWDLEFFHYLEPGTASQGFLKLFARSIASSFLFLAGLSLVLAHGRAIRWPGFWRRFAMVAGAAAAITVATRVFTPAEFIHFGILHAIAAFSLIGLAFLRLPAAVTLAAAAAALALPFAYRSGFFDHPALWWTGLMPVPPRSNDYVPLFPWIAAFLAGLGFGRIALDSGFIERLRGRVSADTPLAIAGRHSLLVYLVHQPVLIALVWLFSQVVPAPMPDPAGVYLRSCQRDCMAVDGAAAMCTQFCGCTLQGMQQDGLFEPFMKGEINGATDPRLTALADRCTAQGFGAAPAD